MNFFEYFETESSETRVIVDIFKQLDFSEFKQSVYNYNWYKVPEGFNLMDISYKFYGTIDDWWVIFYFNDMKDLMFDILNDETRDKILQRHIFALRYYISLAGNTPIGSDHFKYQLALTLGKQAVGSVIVDDDLDDDGIKDVDYYLEMGRLYLLEVLREYYIYKGQDLTDAIVSANNIFKNQPDEIMIKDFRNFLYPYLLKFDYDEVKVPTLDVRNDMKAKMYELKRQWNEEE